MPTAYFLNMDSEPDYTRSNPHRYFDFSMWQAEVAEGCCQRGYAGWVAANLEQTRHELADAELRFEGSGGRSIELAEEVDELRGRLEELVDESPEMDALLNSEARNNPLG